MRSIDDQLTIEKLVGVSSFDGVGCERSDELEGVDLAGFAEQSLSERRRLDALALRAFSETPSRVVVEFYNQASHVDQPTTCRTGALRQQGTGDALRLGDFLLCIPPEKL